MLEHSVEGTVKRSNSTKEPGVAQKNCGMNPEISGAV